MSYRFYNANSRGKFVNDCQIRAISTAEGKTWDETYGELSIIAQRNGIVLDDVNFIRPFLDSRYERIKVPKMTVGEFAEDYPEHVYLVTMQGHITCIKYGVVIDTWDCRDRLVEFVWLVK